MKLHFISARIHTVDGWNWLYVSFPIILGIVHISCNQPLRKNCRFATIHYNFPPILPISTQFCWIKYKPSQMACILSNKTMSKPTKPTKSCNIPPQISNSFGRADYVICELSLIICYIVPTREEYLHLHTRPTKTHTH